MIFFAFQIGEVSTPWPAFSIVASNSGHFLSGKDNRATDMFRNRFLPALAEGAAFFKSNTSTFKSSVSQNTSMPATAGISGSLANMLGNKHYGDFQSLQFDSNAMCDDSVSLIMKRFGHQQVDAQRWLDRTQYALPSMAVDAERMRRALQTLQAVGLVPEEYPVRKLWGGSSRSPTAPEVLCNEAISFRQSSSSADTAAKDEEGSTQLADVMRSALML